MFDDNFFKRINEEKDKREFEVKRLMAEPPKESPKVGDKVIVAVGLLGHGFNWIRQECKVLEVADNSVKIKWKDSHDWEEWIHPAFITDILSVAKNSS